MPHKVTYCKKGMDGTLEEFSYTTKGECDKQVPWNNTVRIVKYPPEDVFTGINHAVELAGDKLWIRIIPDNRTKPPTHCKAVFLMPGDSRECTRLTIEYAESVKAKLPVAVEPFALASIQLELGADGKPEVNSAADYELYDMAANYERVSVEYKGGRKVENRYRIFKIDEIEAVNAPIPDPEFYDATKDLRARPKKAA